MFSGPRISRAPWGLLGAAVVAFAVEAWLTSHDLDFARPENAGWRFTRFAASHSAPGRDVLCLGTSMVQTGVIPRLIEDRTGRPAFSLAAYGGQMPQCYYLLKRAYAAGAKPSALVIDFPPNFLGSGLDGQTAAWPDVLGTRDALDMARALGDARFFAAVMCERAIPSVYYRLQVCKAVVAALRGESASLRFESLTYLRNHIKNLGAFMTGKRPEYHGEISAAYKATFLRKTWAPDPLKARYFRRLIELAASNGTRVYWLMTPFVPELQAARDADDLDAAYNHFAWAMTAKYPNLTVLDARHAPGYTPAVFLDAVHLDVDGAMALTHSIADALTRAGDGPRSSWVRFGPCRPGPSGAAPVELASESSKALTDRGLRR